MALNLFKDRNLSASDISRNYNYKCMKEINDGVNAVIPLASNVYSYGAKGDGVTNDVAAINKALAANNDTIYFPAGDYVLSQPIVIANKSYFNFVCDNNVTFRRSTGNLTTGLLRFENCSNLSVDPFTIITVNITGGYGLYFEQCTGQIRSPVVHGPFEYGIVCEEKPQSGLDQFVIDKPSVKNCETGIYLKGEYYEVLSPQINGCTKYGVWNLGGNNSIIGGHINTSDVGLYVTGLQTTNADHGKIVGCTLNHNLSCGIFVKGTDYSFSINDCQIWATSGGPGLVAATAVAAKDKHFGIYLENVENINITGCTIARQEVNMGCDGYASCTITGNNFIANVGLTTGHVIEYGIAQTEFNGNLYNCYVGNSFAGNLPGSQDRRIAFISNANARNYSVSASGGDTGNNFLNVSAAATGNIIVDANYTNLVCAITTTAVLEIHSSLAGSNIDISIYGITAGQTKAMIATTAIGSGNVPFIIGTGVTYTDATGTYLFSKNGNYTFRAFGALLNQWVITCPP